MSIDDFYSQLYPEVKKIVQLINDHGFKVGFIGGAVRDFYLMSSHVKTTDFDCELRPVGDSSDFAERFSKLQLLLAKSYKVELLSFNVLRLMCEDFECEFSLPRIEKFKNEFSHSNFSATFISDLDYEHGFARRDFTLNAIMIEVFNCRGTLIDPLGGKSDLERGLLVPCGESFFKDPVRFLRAVRFELKLTKKSEKVYKLAPELIEAFKQVKLEYLPAHYIRSEMKNSEQGVMFFKHLFMYLDGVDNYVEQTKLISKYDEVVVCGKAAQYLSDLIFMPGEFIERAQMCMGGKIKLPPSNAPFGIKNESGIKLVEIFNYLKNCKEELIDFFYKEQLVDIDFSGLNYMRNLKIDTSCVDVVDRKVFQVEEKKRKYYENH